MSLYVFRLSFPFSKQAKDVFYNFFRIRWFRACSVGVLEGLSEEEAFLPFLIQKYDPLGAGYDIASS